MLPDFPTFGRDVLARLSVQVRAARGGAPFSEHLPPFQQHEGNRFATTRSDGSVVTGVYDNPVRADVTLTVDEVRGAGARASYDALARLQEQLDESIGRRTFEAIEAAAASVGNATDLKGKPLTGADVLDVYERITLSFASDGTWLPPQVLVHPATQPKVDAAMAEIDRDPALQARRAAIVDRQREAWRGREARRALAD